MAVVWSWIAATPAAVAAVLGVVFATAGWIYTARRNRSLSRKQHTFNALLQSSFNQQYQDNIKIVRPYIRGEGFPDLNLQPNEQLREAAVFLLNHYEFLAAGIRNGDMAERLLRDILKGTIIKTFEASQKLIAQIREQRNRRAVFEHVEWLYERWHEKPPPMSQRVIESVIARPLYHSEYRWWCMAAAALIVIVVIVSWLHLPGEPFNHG